MDFLTTIRSFIINLEKRRFYQYVIAVFVIFSLVMIGIVVRHYFKVNSLKKQIRRINRARNDAQQVLTNHLQVQKRRDEVTAKLDKDPNFNIRGYFNTLITDLDIEITEDSSSEVDREDEYKEESYTIRFTRISMKQLTELLKKVEKNERIFSKELEITRSKKDPNTIDVNVTFATFIPKEVVTQEVE